MQLSCKYVARALWSSVFAISAVSASFAQESPFFVTYTHHMEEPGNLDVEISSTSGIPRSGQKSYFAPYLDLEYGATAQWTTELYLEGQSTWRDSTVFTGWRWENRYKVLRREHWINPDRKSTRLNSSHLVISYAVFCLKNNSMPTLTVRLRR